MIVDTHNHLLISHARSKSGVFPAVSIDDLCVRMRRGDVSAVGLIVGGTVSFPLEDVSSPWEGTIDGLRRFWRGQEEAARDLVVLTEPDEIDAISVGHPAVLIGIEGGEPCFSAPQEDPIAALHVLTRLGVRSLQLIGDPEGPAFVSGSNEAGALQLSSDGRTLIREATRLGMIIDLAHFSGDEPAFDEIISLAESPPIASHHSCRAVNDMAGALSDAAIRKIASAGGVIGIHTGSHWLCGSEERQGTLDDILRHIRHVVDIAGIDHVAIGTDHIDVHVLPMDLPNAVFMADFNGPEDLGIVEAKLRDSGFDAEERAKILSDNVFRVWRLALDKGSIS